MVAAVSAAQEKMRAEGLAEIAVETFAHYEQLLRDGDQGVIRESEIEPVSYTHLTLPTNSRV